jgi:hypothetical protein
VLLGALHGPWLYFERDRWRSAGQLHRFGLLSGAVFGLLGFPPAFARTSLIVSPFQVGVFLAAALLGGAAAGLANARFYLPQVRPQVPSGWRRRLVAGCLIVLPLAAFEYLHYGSGVLRRWPIPALAENSVLRLPVGDARGSDWAGCYDYSAEFFEASGIVGTTGGRLRLVQQEGRLQLEEAASHPLHGGIDQDGRFWAGGQRAAPDGPVLRTLIQGKFVRQGEFTISLRSTVLKGGTVLNSTHAEGKGHRVSCSASTAAILLGQNIQQPVHLPFAIVDVGGDAQGILPQADENLPVP